MYSPKQVSQLVLQTDADQSVAQVSENGALDWITIYLMLWQTQNQEILAVNQSTADTKLTALRLRAPLPYAKKIIEL